MDQNTIVYSLRVNILRCSYDTKNFKINRIGFGTSAFSLSLVIHQFSPACVHAVPFCRTFVTSILTSQPDGALIDKMQGLVHSTQHYGRISMFQSLVLGCALCQGITEYLITLGH